MQQHPYGPYTATQGCPFQDPRDCPWKGGCEDPRHASAPPAPAPPGDGLPMEAPRPSPRAEDPSLRKRSGQEAENEPPRWYASVLRLARTYLGREEAAAVRAELDGLRSAADAIGAERQYLQRRVEEQAAEAERQRKEVATAADQLEQDRRAFHGLVARQEAECAAARAQLEAERQELTEYRLLLLSGALQREGGQAGQAGEAPAEGGDPAASHEASTPPLQEEADGVPPPLDSATSSAAAVTHCGECGIKLGGAQSTKLVEGVPAGLELNAGISVKGLQAEEREELERLRAQSSAMQGELVALKAELQRQESKAKTITDQATEYEALLQEARRTLAPLETANASLQGDVSAAAGRCAALELQLADQARELREAREQVEEGRVALEARAADREMLGLHQEKEQLLRRQLDLATGELEGLRRQLVAQAEEVDRQRRKQDNRARLQAAAPERAAVATQTTEEQSAELERVQAELTSLREW
eukprot:EG_transcript_10101